MIRSAAAGLLFLFAIVSSASAQTCSVPNPLTNGTNADATQVMANFNALLTCVNGQTPPPAPRSYLAGLTLSTAGSSANFLIAVGTATSDDATTSMNLTTASAKTTGAWAVGSGSGSLDTGSIANSTWYHVFLIERTDTGVVDVLISQSLTSPTLPANYTKKRRIGSMKTDPSAHWFAFFQTGDFFQWNAPPNDANGLSVSTGSTAISLSVPPGLNVIARFNAEIVVTSAGGSVLFYSPTVATQTINVPNGNVTMTCLVAGNVQFAGPIEVLTSTSSGITATTNQSGVTTSIVTIGWIDRRGRDN